ncbi:MAG TPA: YaiO family outer membrane beta-barrel protein [Chlorobium sp.]|nr:YaiO family outer membrane beta-barrel protein [Chlorobium sp.]
MKGLAISTRLCTMNFRRAVSLFWGVMCLPVLVQATPLQQPDPDGGYGSSGRPAVFDAASSVEAGASLERLSNGYDDWSCLFVKYVRPLGPAGLAAVEIRQEGRFGKEDDGLNGSWAVPFSSGVLSLEGGISPDSDFLPRWKGLAGWNGRLPDGFGYSMEVQRREYKTVELNGIGLGAEKYLGRYRFAYTAALSSLDWGRGELVTSFRYSGLTTALNGSA